MRKWFSVKDLEVKSPESRNYLIKQEYKSRFVDVWPFYRYGANEVLNIFRLLPAKLEDELTPFRLSNEPRGYGPWIYAAVIANIGGRRGVTFIVGNRLTDDEFSIREKPIFVLFDAAKRLLASRIYPHWTQFNLIKGYCDNPNAVPKLIRPEIHYLSFGLTVQHPYYKFTTNKFHGLDPSEPLHIIVMRRSLGEKLMDILDACLIAKESTNRDIIDLDNGELLLVYPSRDPNVMGFTPQIMKNFGDMSASLASVKNQVIQKLDWWDNVLHFPTIEEQVKYICQSDIPAEVIYRCLKDKFGQYIPEAIINIAEDQIRGKKVSVQEQQQEITKEFEDFTNLGNITIVNEAPEAPEEPIANQNFDIDGDIRYLLGLSPKNKNLSSEDENGENTEES